MAGQATAGPITTVITSETAIAAQATLNNRWSTSFMASGTTAAASGDAVIFPFASSEAGPADGVPATFLQAAILLVPDAQAGIASGVAGYSSRAGKEDGQGGERVIVGLSDDLGGLQLVASPGPEQETLAGQLDGVNIGTESLILFGRDNNIPRQLETTVFWF